MEFLQTVKEDVSEDYVSDDGITDEEFYNMPLFKNATVLNESTHSDIIASRKSVQDQQDIWTISKRTVRTVNGECIYWINIIKVAFRFGLSLR